MSTDQEIRAVLETALAPLGVVVEDVSVSLAGKLASCGCSSTVTSATSSPPMARAGSPPSRSTTWPMRAVRSTGRSRRVT